MYFFSRKLFFFDHHAIQGENPKVSKRPVQKVLLTINRTLVPSGVPGFLDHPKYRQKGGKHGVEFLLYF